MFALTGTQTGRLVLAALIVGSALAVLRMALRGRDPRQRVSAAYKYLDQRGLAARPDLVALAVRFQAAASAWTMWLLFGLLVIMGNVLALWPYLPGKTLLDLAVPLMTPLVTLAAVLRVQLLRRTTPPPRGPHVAHVARASIDDYVPPPLRWWPAITVVVSGVVIAIFAVTRPAEANIRPGVAVAGWCIATPFLFANMPLARWLVARPQPATTPEELALRNELTSDTVGLLLGFATLGLWLTTFSTSAVIYFAEPIGFALFGIPYLLETRRRRRVRERLWTPRGRPPHPPMPLAGS
jgi:hypothetical protein